MVEQPVLSRQAAPVAGQRTAGADHPMTGDDDRDGIGSVGSPDGPAGGRTADPCGDLPVAGRCARRNLAQCPPYLPLERGAPRFDWQIIQGNEIAGEIFVERRGNRWRRGRVR